MLSRSKTYSTRFFQEGKRKLSHDHSVEMSILPGIKSALFPVVNQPFQIALFRDLELEFTHNPFVTTMLTHLDELVTHHHCNLRWSPTLAMDIQHHTRFKAICFFDRYTQTILIPSSPEAYHSIYGTGKVLTAERFYRDNDAMYLCMFLHEANHAHDHIVGKFIATKQDALAIFRANRAERLFPELAMWKLDLALSIDYQHPDMNNFKEAMKADFYRLNGLLRRSSAKHDDKLQTFARQLRISLHHYPVTDILLELKSRLIEFSTMGTFGTHFLYDKFPATTKWYLHEYLPKTELTISPTQRLK